MARVHRDAPERLERGEPEEVAPDRPAVRPVTNPPSPWRAETLDWLGAAPEADFEIYSDHSKTILSKNDSPDISFTWSVNPYRGCAHACAYCYARPTHQYLDLGAGTDFDKKIVIKPDAPKLLEEAFRAPKWRGELVVFSGNTDCYQPFEAHYGLTRGCLEVCLAFRNPVGIITKSAVIERDAALLGALHREAHATVTVSIPFMDEAMARAVEPLAPSPKRRFRVIETLAAAGVPVGVNIAPIVPGLSEEQAPAILEAARRAGATWFGLTLVRLPREVRPVFESRIEAAFPQRAQRIFHAIEDCRGGARTDGRYFSRMEGTGARWQAIETLIDTTARRLGYGSRPEVPSPSPFRRPGTPEQLALFPPPIPGRMT